MTSKIKTHFMELMYLGGKCAYYKQNMALLGSKLPYTSKLRFAYGFDLQTKKIENISLSVKVHYTKILNKKSYHTADTNFNIALNYYFLKINFIHAYTSNVARNRSRFTKSTF